MSGHSPDTTTLSQVATVDNSAILNMAPGALRGQSVFTFFPAESRIIATARVHELYHQHRAEMWTALLHPRNHPPIHASFSVTAIVARGSIANAPLTAIRWLVRDVTARMVAEEALRNLNATMETHIAQRTAELARAHEANLVLLSKETAARAAAESANAAKDRLLAMVSHELRDPLHAIALAAEEMTRHHGLATEQRDQLGIIRRNVHLQGRLVNDLLDFHRSANGKLHLELQPVDVHVIVRNVIADCRAVAGVKMVRLTGQLVASAHVVLADEGRLQQVFSNLIHNALKFTPENGHVTVHTAVVQENTRGVLTVTVRDSGVGIAPQEIGAIFDPFRQVAQTQAAQGLGLGLAVAKGIVEAAGGTIQAASEGLGRGAVFTVRLPLSDLPVAVRSVTGKLQRSKRGLEILIVDDYIDSAKSTARLLKVLGHIPTVAATLRDAVAQAQAQRFDLLLVDLHLPDGRGEDLLAKLGADRPPAAAFTGTVGHDEVQKSRAAGFVEHFGKPLSLDRFEAFLNTL